MAYFQRLIFFVILFLPCVVHADIEWRTRYSNSWYHGNSAQGACDAMLHNLDAGSSSTAEDLPDEYLDTGVWINFGRCVLRHSSGSLAGQIPLYYRVTCAADEVFDPSAGQCRSPCPDGQLPDENGECPCPVGQVKNPWFGTCQDECPSAGAGVSRSHVAAGNPVCLFGCKRARGAHPGGSSCVLVVDVNTGGGGKICDYAYTGEMCGWFGELGNPDNEPQEGDDPDETPRPPPEDDPCGPGMQKGTFNGKEVCIKSGPPVDKDETKKKDTTTNNGADTTTTNTETNVTGRYDEVTNTTTITRQIVRRETETNNETGESTTTTTTTEVDVVPGNKVGSSGGEGGGEGACDPSIEDCGGSTWHGDCGIAPVCEGDAIQCAIAAAVFETECKLRVSEEVMQAFEAIRDFQGTGEGEGLDRVEIEVPEVLDVTMQGGGAGLDDQSFTVWGREIVIPWSRLNIYLVMFGYAVLAIAWIRAYQIVAGVI